MRIYETIYICFDKIHRWHGAFGSIDIRTSWHTQLVAWVADDGHTVHTYAGDGHNDDDICS